MPVLWVMRARCAVWANWCTRSAVATVAAARLLKACSKARVGVGEATGFKRIQCQQSPGRASQLQHATHAVMHMQLGNRLALLGDQSVIRVRQRAVGLEAHGLPCSHQLGKARVLAEVKAPPQRVGHQATQSPWAQILAFQSQQCDGICW